MNMRMRIMADFAEVSRDIKTFRSNIRDDIAAVASVSKDRVVIRSVAKGSVIVDFILTETLNAGEPVALVAANALQAKVTQPASWSPTLRPIMEKGVEMERPEPAIMRWSQVQQIKEEAEGTRVRFMPALATWKPPSDCVCQANASAGITTGCAQHHAISPAWCLVVSNCTSAQPGSWGMWVQCNQIGGSSNKATTWRLPASGSSLCTISFVTAFLALSFSLHAATE